MSRILVVDDEQDICDILRFNLEGAGFDVATCNSAEEALTLLTSGLSFDLILLDVMMDAMSGFEMAKQLREGGDTTPIIFLTALVGDDNQLEGFSSGADDYIYKPFSAATVLARVNAVLRRTAAVSSSAIIEVDGLRLVPTEESVYQDGVRLPLTKKEYLILLLLLRNRGQHLSREQIMADVWGDEVCVGDRSVDVHIARLRRKLGHLGARLANRSGFGYIFQ